MFVSGPECSDCFLRSLKQCSLLKKDEFFEKKKLKILNFFLNDPATRHIKYRVVDFAPSNVEIMPDGLFQSIWNYFYSGFLYA